MGDRYVELERLKKRPPVFVGPHGKIIPPGKARFTVATDGTIKPKEEPKAWIYPCPICKMEFKEIRNVYRHLRRGHKKEEEEAKQLKKKALKNARQDDGYKEDPNVRISCKYLKGLAIIISKYLLHF